MKIKGWIIIGAVILCFSIQAWAATKGVTYYGKPRPQKVRKMSDSYCVKIHEDFRVCQGTRDDSTDNIFYILKGRTIIKEWATAYPSFNDFEVITADLDGDGAKEIIISDSYTVSNIFSHIIHVVSPYPDKAFNSIATLSMDEFGVDGSFVPNPKTNEIFIMSCRWFVGDEFEPEKNYLTGTFVRYKNGKLLPVFEKKSIRRKGSATFNYKRMDTRMNKNKPALLRLKSKEVIDTPWAETKQIVLVQKGVIESIEIRKEDPVLKNDPDLRDNPYRENDPTTKWEKTKAINVRLNTGEKIRFVTWGATEQGSITLNYFEGGFTDGKIRVDSIIEVYDAFDTLVGVNVEVLTVKDEDGAEHKCLFYKIE